MSSTPSNTFDTLIFRALGNALANWQHVETGMIVAVHGLLGTAFDRTSAVFFHHNSATAKLQLLDKLLLLDHDGKWIKANWKPLRKEVQHAIDIRNALAHFEVTLLTSHLPDVTNYPVAITPHHLDVLSVKNGSVRMLSVESLLTVTEEYSEVGRKLLRFAPGVATDWTQQLERLPPKLQHAIETLLDRDNP